MSRKRVKSYRVKMLADYTYRPLGVTAWNKRFKCGWKGPVTPDEYAAIIASGAGVAYADQQAKEVKADESGQAERADND